MSRFEGSEATVSVGYARPMSGHAWLILPTFDEAENLEAIVRAALGGARARAPPARTGSSSSTTTRPTAPAAIADRLAAEFDAVEVLHRTVREGLGPAYLAGFAHALDGRRGVRPRDGRRLLARPRRPRAPARRRAGRRPRARLALRRRRRRQGLGPACGGSSAAAARGTRRSCSALRVRDLTGGFKCFRREVLEAIDLPTIRARGYAFQVELTNRARARAASRSSSCRSSSAIASSARRR